MYLAHVPGGSKRKEKPELAGYVPHNLPFPLHPHAFYLAVGAVLQSPLLSSLWLFGNMNSFSTNVWALFS